jgi:hypothetical protein
VWLERFMDEWITAFRIGIVNEDAGFRRANGAGVREDRMFTDCANDWGGIASHQRAVIAFLTALRSMLIRAE